MGRFIVFTALVLSFLAKDVVFAQDLSSDDYKKALWMTTRFYGGQRSGDNNWLIYDHLPSGVNSNLRGKAFRADRDGSVDLSGGWHDCGDHVKFGQTQFYSAYVLIKTYEQFKEGFDDYYSADYAGYGSQSTSGSAPGWQWEGNGHDPNGIPDILDELKHETDFLIKCTPNGSTFYYQIGDGGSPGDHATNNTAVTVQTLAVNQGGNNDNGNASPSGPFRGAYKNPIDGAMASMCAATLALMSKQYESFDPAYAALCLTHAQNAYTYASSHVGQAAGTANGGFYSAHDNAYNPWAICLGEMYKATGQSSYLSTMNALSVGLTGSPQVKPNVNYSFDYANIGELALFVMAELGNATAKTSYNSHYTNHWINGTNYTGEGNYKGGGGWGQLRYTGNASLIVALYSKLNNLNTLNAKVYDNVDYILGSNNAKQSFVVGYAPTAVSGVNYAQHPHHRNAYLRDDTPSGGEMSATNIPAKNIQMGALVGGNKSSSGSYDDTWTEYVNTEVCIDYNAGILGGLAAINAFDHPIDTNKFLTACSSPGDLGGDQTLCGAGSLDLDAGLTTQSGRTFQWYKDDIPQGSASSSATTIAITEAGVWKVVVDSSGECSRSSSVTITGVLPDVDLGGDKELCTPAEISLDAGVTGNGVTYSWTKDAQSFGTTKTIDVTEAGAYEVAVSASGCPSKTGSVNVTSLLPMVDHDTICSAGNASLSVLSSGGPFDWYANATGGSSIHTGTTYTPSVSSDATYYVKDAGSIEQEIGPSSSNNPLTGTQNGGSIGVAFTASSGFDITELKVLPYVYSCNGDNVSVTIELQNGSGGSISTHTPVGVTCTGVQSGDPFDDFYTLDFSADPIKITSAGDYIIKPTGGNQLIWFDAGASYSNYKIDGVIQITGDTRGDKSTSFPGIFDIKVSTGSDCDRTPVNAIIDAGNPNCSGGCTPPTSAAISPSAIQNMCTGESVTLTANAVSGYLYRWYKDGSAYTTAAVNDNTLEVTEAGVYTVRIGDGDVDGTCHLTSSSVTVNINAMPTASITSSMLNYCSGDNGVTLTASDAGTGAVYSWNGPVTGTGVTLGNATAGVYTIEVTKDGCTATSASKTIVEDALPTAEISTTALSYCVGDNGITLTATNAGSGAVYSWSGPVTGSGVTLSNATTGVYTVEVTKDGCTATSSSKTVSTDTPPTANITTSALNYCSGDNGVLLEATDAGVGVTYSWSGPVTGSGLSLSSATAGSYTVTASRNGCASISGAKVVVEDALPSADISSTLLNYCSGDNGITLTAFDAGTGATYVWNGPVTGSSVTLGNATAGIYTVEVSKDGCTATSSSKTVVEDALPTANISNSLLSYCIGDNGITLNAEDAGAGATYNWSGPVSGTGVTLSNATAGDYSVEVTKSGCSSTSSLVSVTADALPTASIATSVLNYCEGENGITLSATNAGSGATYSWSGPVVGTGINLANATAGTYTVSVTKDGCTAVSGSEVIIENVSPVANITNSLLNYCEGESGVSLSAEDAGVGASYSWSGPVVGTGINLADATAGTYLLTVVKDGCTSVSSSKTVVENLIPLAQITTSGAGLYYCSGVSAGVGLSAADAGTGSNYTWSGPVVGTGIDLADATVGTYSVTVTQNGCSAVSSQVIVIEDCSNSCTPPSSVSIDQGAVYAGCEGTNEIISGVATTGSPVGEYYYTWILDNGTETNLTTPSTSYQDLSLTSLSASDIGVIKLRVEDSDGLTFNDPQCYIDGSVNFDVLESTQITGFASGGNVCQGDQMSFEVQAIGSNLSYQWMLNGSDVGVNSSNIMSSDTISSLSVYTVEVTGDCGVEISNDYVLDIMMSPSITDEPTNVSACDGDAATLVVNAIGDGTLSYVWTKVPSVVVGGDSPILDLNSLSASDEGDYFVDITNNCGTISSQIAAVEVSSGVSPSVSISSDITSLCDDGDIVLTALGSGGGNSPTYTFLQNNVAIVGATNSLSNTYTVSNVSSTTNFSVEMTSNSSCLATGAINPVVSQSADVTVEASPVASIQYSELEYCEGGNGVLLTAEDAGTGVTYDWIGPISTSESSIAGATEGEYILEVTKGECSTTSSAVSVVENALPIAQIETSGAGLVYCSNDVNGADLSTIDAGVGASYLWSGPVSGTGMTLSDATIGTYSVDVTLNNCVATSQTVEITENCTSTCTAPSEATVTATSFEICDGDIIDLVANNELGYYYEWYNGGSLISSGIDLNIVTVSTIGDYSVRIAETVNDINDGACYLESTPVTINVKSLPVANVTTSGTSLTYCSTSENGVVLAAENAGTGASYTWDGPVNGSGVSLAGASEGAYFVSVTLDGCTSISPTVSVVEDCGSVCTPPASAVINSNSPVSICNGGILDLTANTQTGYYYEWYNGNALIATGVDFTIQTVSTAGDYRVRIIDGASNSNDASCYLESNIISVEVDEAPSTVPTLMNGSLLVCTNSSNDYQFTSASTGETLVIECESGCAGVAVSQTGNVATVVASSNDFAIAAYYENACGVSVKEIVDISIEQSSSPSISIAADNESVCDGGRTRFTASLSNAGTTPVVEWFLNGSSQTTGSTYQLSDVTNGDAVSAILSSTSICGVSGIGNSNVINMSTFIIDGEPEITGPDTVCLETTSIATYSVSNNQGSIYSWSLPDSAIFINGEGTNVVDIDFREENGGIITVAEIAAGGCYVGTGIIDVKNDCIDGVEDGLFDSNIELYPNPSVSTFTLNIMSAKETFVRVVDAKGVIVDEFNVNSNESIQFGDDLNQGVYLLQLINEASITTRTINKID